MNSIRDVLQDMIPSSVPLGKVGCYVEWQPLQIIDQHEIANLLPGDIALMSNTAYGKVLDCQWHEIDALESYYSGWCYLVQQINPKDGKELSGKLWWIDEEDLSFTGALRRRNIDASQVEIFEPPNGQPICDFSETIPLWWRASQ
ncbi:MAG: hypothetical protein SNJ57_09350 [Cyanobacteriota bacterium]